LCYGKTVINNGKPVAILVNVHDLQELYDRVLAVELKAAYEMALAEEKRGELIRLEDMAAKYGFRREDFDLEAMRDGNDE
jgi:hypothetical protein